MVLIITLNQVPKQGPMKNKKIKERKSTSERHEYYNQLESFTFIIN